MTAHGAALDDAGVRRLCRALAHAKPTDFVACDTETGGSPAGLEAFGDKATFHPYAGAYITGMSVCLTSPGDSELFGWYIPVGHERGNVSGDAARILVEHLDKTAARHVGHHWVFDTPFINQIAPFAHRADTIDTQVVRWHQNENLRRGLKVMGEMYLGEDAGEEKRALAEALESPWENQTHAYKAVRAAYPEIPVSEARGMARRMRAKRGWHQITVDEMAPYAARDSTLTYQVLGVLEDQGALAIAGLDRELALQPILAGMTRRGVPVDLAQLDAAVVEYDRRADEIGEGLHAEFGISNPASSIQCQKLLYEDLGLPIMLRTEKGAPATDKNALEMLQGHPVASRVLEYRKWKHAASQATGYGKHARLSADERIHGHYRSDGTVTGRLSSSGPNVMNTPRDDTNPEIAQAFAYCPPGIERYRFDLVSAELWITASITGDPLLTETLLAGNNLHAEMMIRVFGGEKDKSRREYTLAKNVNYGIEYGAGLDQIATFAAKAGYGPEEARRVAKVARDGHKEVFARQHRVADFLAEEAEKRGQLPLHIPGRYRHFHGPGKQVGYYTALNALVQGGCAEWMKTVMLEIKARGYEDLLTLQVHDEFHFHGPPGIGQELLELLQSITRDLNPFKFAIPWEPK